MKISGIGVFKRVAVALSGRLRGAKDTRFGRARDKGIERVKRKFAAEAAIENLRDRSPAVFVTKLEIVPAFLPR